MFNKMTQQIKTAVVKRKRKRNVICFNPTYSANVKTIIRKAFFKAIKKSFPDYHQFYKIFNINIVKASYSCMKNMATITSLHNLKILKSSVNTYGCNCRDRNSCQLHKKCKTPQTVYPVDV